MALVGNGNTCWFQRCGNKPIHRIRYYNKTVMVCNKHKNLDGAGCAPSRRRPKDSA
ncbi:hypothetical protein SEA_STARPLATINUM_108 [Streptomyces phage StarPlatinum]|uniref:Uncharacterized protein n=1 Tax=Streptomyces phage StarPlatinum TaxID=2283265 RepID=A0A345M8N2_9CAUD|nr:hypothetical protein HWB77_gp184 [Streptomyces phage StarPlatinum]AXH66853.1 hypothetical protein SEA_STARPLATINUM_108 [Streptomyces phage StarPlatinum]